ncbi:MAG: tRNA (adenosine(37)-N6)-threonylcarbamoyltransferase complex dimerization subunit type 1 TsaB [Spirochaetes bacterium]|nr:tRNA (adenosine(37)-N6)-threonylcarbamoyltransferase complex dimerization subunit type 1 TsaB [Spirochaetota bacterium]
MNLLALDTSTEVLSIFCASGIKTMELTRDIDLRHSEQLIPLVDWVLRQLTIKPKDLDLVVTAGGPGSFTGLRIGMAFAKGLAGGIGCPYVSVSILDAYAARFSMVCNSFIAPVIDAKKQRFYTALWKGPQRISEYLDISPQEFLHMIPKDQSCILTGPHAHILKTLLHQDTFLLDPAHRCGAAPMLAKLGIEKYQAEGPAKDNEGPLYVRKSDAEIAKREL